METNITQEQILGTFASFQDALSACGGSGYDDESIANVVLWKTRIYRELLGKDDFPKVTANQARQLLGLSLSIKDGRLSVLDFGGACGVNYFLAKKVFGDTININWIVVETAAMCAKGKTLESDELRFFDSLESAVKRNQGYDLVFASGSLQYVPSPFGTLQQLIDCNAPNLFLTRTALSTDDNESIFIHESRLPNHGRGGRMKGLPDLKTQCPVVIASKKKIEEMLAAKYEIVMELTESLEAYKVGESSFNQYGYYCRLKVH